MALILGAHIIDTDPTFVGSVASVTDVVESATKIVTILFLDVILDFIPNVLAALGGFNMSYFAPFPVFIRLTPDRQVFALLDDSHID